MYAIQHGLPAEHASHLTGLVLAVVIISILVHGVSVTPIMNFYEHRKKKAR
jgi:NhaP-type Na+/H+ or K+/H+ antiporter